jgi:hypothetical protein
MCDHEYVIFHGETPTHGPTSAECEECGATTTELEFDVDENNVGYHTPVWS